ncbi:SOS response-associated peptidase family protein [Variovorax robiniae]|uniref:Abasic site processing protein n=1 Tax=Variovorax robiniae TaxID=1836199 RepID=A0ABU8XDS0_9BURK
MTIVYESARDTHHYQERFQLPCVAPAPFVRPGERGLFVRRPRGDRGGASPDSRYEAALGRWGLIPLFAGSQDYPATFEARGESASRERDFLQPWKRGHRCIVLADALYRRGENDQRMVRVTRADGEPLALAGLWNGWRAPDGQCVESFALLTLPSEEQPGERRAVFLREGWLDDWLHCPVEEAAACLRPYDLGKLLRTPVDEAPPREVA